MIEYLIRSLERHCSEAGIAMYRGYDVSTASDVIAAQKGAYGFKIRFTTEDYMEDGWVKKLSRLMYGLVQYAIGMWFTPDGEDQFQMNFELIKYKEEEEYETVFSSYPRIKECTRSIGL